MNVRLKMLVFLALLTGAACDGSGSVLFDQAITLEPRMKTQVDFEAPAETALLVEVNSDGAVHVTVEDPSGAPLVNDERLKKGPWSREIRTSTAGKYRLRFQNLNLVGSKRLTAKVTVK